MHAFSPVVLLQKEHEETVWQLLRDFSHGGLWGLFDSHEGESFGTSSQHWITGTGLLTE